MTYGSSSFGSTSYGTDGTTRLTVEINFTLDALLTGKKRFILDAVLIKQIFKTFSLDAILVFRRERTFLLDATIQKTQSKTFSLTARIQKGQNKSFTINAILVFRRERTFLLDATIQKTQSKTFSLDARAYVIKHWLNSWKFRRNITVCGTTGGAQADYPIRINIHFGVGVDTTTDIFLNGKCKSDFSDIRFTDSDGQRLLNYYIESSIINDSALVWINMRYIPASPDNTNIYIYYGNESAIRASTSSIFIFFDHFTSIDSAVWTNTGAIIDSETNLLLTGTSNIIAKANTGQVGRALRYSAYFEQEQYTTTGWDVSGVPPYAVIDTHGAGYEIAFHVGETTDNIFATGLTQFYNNFFIYEIKNLASNLSEFYIDEILRQSFNQGFVTSRPIRFQVFPYPSPSPTLIVDWIMVRSVANPEPTICSIGTEQSLFLGRNMLRTHRVGLRIVNG